MTHENDLPRNRLFNMKNSRTTALRFCAMAGCAAILGLSATKIFAIEGLTIKIQGSNNVVLGWPSATNETYIIQHAPALNSTNGWQTLTNFYPAAPKTNWTTYVISNAFSPPSGGGGGTNTGGSGPPPPPMAADSDLAYSETNSAFSELEPGDIMVPPTPWLPETLPSGAIFKANGTYVPLSSPESDGTASPDAGTPQKPPDPGFYLVVQNGVTCVGLTNGMTVSGTVTIPLEIAVPANDFINGAILVIDGTNNVPGGVAVVGPLNLWTFYWNTTWVSNGKHQVSAQVIFSEGSADVEATNLLTVTVTNLVSFPNYYATLFGEGYWMWINAQSAVPNVDWEVEVCDSQSNHLTTLGPVASPNGLLSGTWNFQTNTNSAPLTNSTFILNYYLFSAATGKSLTGTKPAATALKIGEKPWTPWNMLIACAPIDNDSAHTTAINTMVQVAVVNVCYGNMPGELYPLSGNDPNGNAWTWDSDGNGLTLLNAMPTCSYLYYFGHGTKNSFGIGPWNPAKPNSTNNIWWNDLAAAELQYYLGNWNGTVVPYNATPYKLVFIDGCQSGAGGLPQAFGIPSKQYSTNDFKAAGIRSRAFVGYTEPVTINILNIDGYQDALQAFWTNWFYGHSVHDMVTNSQSAAIFGLGNTMSSSAVIYGATDMFIGSP